MKKDRLLSALTGVVLTAVFALCAWQENGITESLELMLYDARLKASPALPSSDQILLVSIDDASIAKKGRWPWPRGQQGELLRRIGAGGPKVIGVNIFWLEKDSGQGLTVVEALKEKYEGLIAGKQAAFQSIARDRRFRAPTFDKDLLGFTRSFDEAMAYLDQDGRLAEVLAATPKVVLPLLFSRDKPLADETDETLTQMPYQVAAASGVEGYAMAGFTPALPLSDFSADVSGQGFSNLFPDVDGAVRAQPMVMQYRGKYFPSLPLEMARLARDLDIEAVKVVPGRSVSLGDKTVPLDASSRLLIRFSGEDLPMVPAMDVLDDKVEAKVFKNKIILIAPRAVGVDTSFVTPVSSVTPGADVQLNALLTLLGDRFIVRPEWAPLAELAGLALIGLFVIVVMPFMRATLGAVMALILLAAIGGAGGWLFITKGWWIKIFYPMGLLVVSYTATVLRRLFFTEKRKELAEAEGIETNKALGLQFQQQGMLDMAFEKFRRCPVDAQMKELLYNLALDFERKRQFGKAASAYEHISQADPNYKDVKQKISGAKQASETMISGPLGRPRDGSATIVGGSSSVNPTLGKYEIQKELGRGAMGVVYLGKDPKINRLVAIKTLNLDSDLDEASAKDVKERFFREAESAGTLNHPNIVKIFDADEDKSTQISFISMELLDGEDLKKYAEKANLLPVPTVLEYVAAIADALDYAHAAGVVHRDIKPANIMKLKDGSLRVTDFGIARITASSKTATGTVMGTPSYMSPEQIAGKKVDGRADLFSLGVMLYEMLTASKPFEGDSIATLLFRIASEPHPDPVLKDSVRVSPAAKAVIDRALQKDPEKRYQRGGEMAREIREALKNPTATPPAASFTPVIPPSVPAPRPAAPAPVAAAPAAAPRPVTPASDATMPAAAPRMVSEPTIPAMPPPAVVPPRPAYPPATAAPLPPVHLPPPLPPFSPVGGGAGRPPLSPTSPSPVPAPPVPPAPAAPRPASPPPAFEIVRDVALPPAPPAPVVKPPVAPPLPQPSVTLDAETMRVPPPPNFPGETARLTPPPSGSEPTIKLPNVNKPSDTLPFPPADGTQKL